MALRLPKYLAGFPDFDRIEKKFEEGKERALRMRAESMEITREVIKKAGSDVGQGFQFAFRTSCDMAQDLAQRASRLRDETREHGDVIRAYIESDAFERDLDRLAERLEMRFEHEIEDRKARIRAKVSGLLGHSRKEIAQAAEKAGLFSLIAPVRRRPRVLVAITIIAGGVKGAGILYECYQVFLPSIRRTRLRAV